MATEATGSRRKLGQMLRRARQDARLTQTRAAVALTCKQPKINKIETTDVTIDSHDLDRLLNLYDVSADQQAVMRQLLGRVVVPAAAGVQPNSAYLEMLALEPAAHEILTLHSDGIPNLLQSEMYMIAQYEQSGDPTTLTTLLERRLERHRLLTDDNQLVRYRVVLSESCLHRMPGGRTRPMVIEQATHLCAMATNYSKLELQIVPYTAPLAFFPPSDVTVLTFADGRQGIAYFEVGTGDGRKYRGKKFVANQEAAWHMVQRAALSEKDSRAFLHDIIERARAATWPYND